MSNPSDYLTYEYDEAFELYERAVCLAHEGSYRRDDCDTSCYDDWSWLDYSDMIN